MNVFIILYSFVFAVMANFKTRNYDIPICIYYNIYHPEKSTMMKTTEIFFRLTAKTITLEQSKNG